MANHSVKATAAGSESLLLRIERFGPVAAAIGLEDQRQGFDIVAGGRGEDGGTGTVREVIDDAREIRPWRRQRHAWAGESRLERDGKDRGGCQEARQEAYSELHEIPNSSLG